MAKMKKGLPLPTKSGDYLVEYYTQHAGPCYNDWHYSAEAKMWNWYGPFDADKFAYEHRLNGICVDSTVVVTRYAPCSSEWKDKLIKTLLAKGEVKINELAD